MNIAELQQIYGKHPNAEGLASLMNNPEIRTIFLEGVHASCTSLFASGVVKSADRVHLFILNDLEEAGYFYHDLVQVDGDEHILFFPSSYRRAIKYGQKDAANEILRTEVLSRLEKDEPLVVVTYPEALAEKVVSRNELTDRTMKLQVGQHVETEEILSTLTEYGFEHVDYVY